MKNKTEVSRTDVCVRVVKGALEGGGGVMAEKMDKMPPSPASHHPSSPPLSPSTPPTQTKIKCESPTVFLGSHTPPPSGPGAEIKGKPGNPIASGSTRPAALSRPNSAGGEEGKVGVGVPASTGGGRLTFFKEGKFLLELSHRTDMGAPAGWVPVKSKTYWPPPSSTTTTTTQHPLRHDTPTSQSVSDDCSSLNSSPWTSDHIRKQPLPRPARGPSTPPQAAPFWFCCPPKARTLRRQMTSGWRRRNPLLQPPVKELATKVEGSKVEGEEKKCVKREKVEGEGVQGRGTARVEKWVQVLWMKAGVRMEVNTTLQSLFEQRGSSSGGGVGEVVDPTFVSPRKRYLRQMETDQDTPSILHRKKLHAAVLPQAPGDRGAGVPQVSSSASSSSSLSLSVSAPHRSAVNALPPSVYSIESILNHEGAGASAGAGAGTGTSRRGDSFLRTLLKPEAKPNPVRPRERPPDPPPPAPVKAEREQAGPAGPERGDPLLDLNRPSPDRYDLSRYGPVAGLYHLAPYVDPRYMMLHSLAPGLVAPTNPPPSEVAQALAAATAAAAAAAGLGTYPLGPLPPPLPGAQYYYPPTSVAAQLLRPPALSSRCSPHPPASPSPKTHYPPPTPASPHLSRGASPRGRASPWQPPPPPAHPLSPHPSLASPLPSPPPQDAPLNLSKPRNHLGK